MSTVLDLTLNDVRHGAQVGRVDTSPDAPLASSISTAWTVGHMRHEEAEMFYRRVQALAEEFPALQRRDQVTEELTAYRLLITLFPTAGHAPRAEPRKENDRA